VINPEILYGNYLYQTSISLGLVEHFRTYAEEVVRQVAPVPNALVLDIGSNDGSLLKAFKDHGLRVLGVDPAREIARKATESGVETIADFFTAKLAREIRKKHGPAAIITANNVFANIDHLADVAAGIRELLAQDGVFVFETSYLLDVLQKSLLETFFHEHLCYFSVRPLEAFFRRNGMELFDVKRVATKGGSIRGFAQLGGGPRKV
jgi:predicted TPR repeat methyltransferase